MRPLYNLRLTFGYRRNSKMKVKSKLVRGRRLN